MKPFHSVTTLHFVNGANNSQLDNVCGVLQPVDFACEIEGSVEPTGVNGVKREPVGILPEGSGISLMRQSVTGAP